MKFDVQLNMILPCPTKTWWGVFYFVFHVQNFE